MANSLAFLDKFMRCVLACKGIRLYVNAMLCGPISADECGNFRQRVVDDAATVPRHGGVPREVSQYPRVHSVPPGAQ